MYMGGAGLYAPTFKYERNPNCVVCGEGVVLQAVGSASLTQLMELLGDDPRLRLKAPSLSVEGGSKLGDGTDGATRHSRYTREAAGGCGGASWWWWCCCCCHSPFLCSPRIS